MIHFINEDGNKALKNSHWVIPQGVLNYLLAIKDNNEKENLTKNPTTKEAYDHLEFVLNSDSLTYQEMKRIKNWFDKNANAKKTKQYELYGGDIMNIWVNNALTTARVNAKNNKEIKQFFGINDRTKDERDSQLSISKVNDYNPETFTKTSKLKELTNLLEQKTIILTEKQITEIQKKLINNIFI